MPTDTKEPETSNLPTSEVIRQGANLPTEEWNEARIAAARSMLPQGFRDPANMIAFLARAQRSGLDPFGGELHAWEDERGELTFMTSRDGFIKILRRDPNVKAVDVGAVYENEEFTYEKDGEGNITVQHKGTMDRGPLKGAYCLIQTDEGADHIEIRLLSDFKHLLGKSNWKNYPIDMLQTRTVSAAARLVTTAAAGIYSEADMELTEGGWRTSQVVKERAEEQTDELAGRLQQEREGGYSEPIEAEAREESEDGGMPDWDDAEDGLDTGGGESDVVDGRPDAPETPAEEDEELTEAEAEAMEDMDADTLQEAAEETAEGLESTAEYICRICTAEYDSQPALNGHMAGHSKRGETLPEGWQVVEGDAGVEGGPLAYYVLDADGVVQGKSEGYGSWQDALADVAAEEAGKASTGSSTTTSTPSSDEEDPLVSVEEEFEGKSRGQILVAVYRALEPYSDATADRILNEEKADLAGVEDGSKVSLNELDRADRLELLRRLRERVANDES